MVAINKETGTEIPLSVYNQLSEKAKSMYIVNTEVTKNVTRNNYNINTKVNAETTDLLGVGKVAEVGAVLAVGTVAALFSIFD